MDRSSFYKWRLRFRVYGFEGLKDLPPVPRSHPQTTPAETLERIKELALAHPAYGCNRIEALLTQEGRRVSAVTIQKILNKLDLGTIEARRRGCEQRKVFNDLQKTYTAEEIATVLELIGAR